jgi:hypothetical protein
MPTPNPFPLDIVNKVNSPELEAYFLQFGPELYESAQDLNKIKQALNYLHENMGSGGSSSSFNKTIRWDGVGTDVPAGFNGTAFNFSRTEFAAYTVTDTTLVLDPADADQYDIILLTSD